MLYRDTLEESIHLYQKDVEKMFGVELGEIKLIPITRELVSGELALKHLTESTPKSEITFNVLKKFILKNIKHAAYIHDDEKEPICLFLSLPHNLL